MDGGAWWATVHGVQSRTRLSDFTFTFHFHVNEEISCSLIWRCSVSKMFIPLKLIYRFNKISILLGFILNLQADFYFIRKYNKLKIAKIILKTTLRNWQFFKFILKKKTKKRSQPAYLRRFGLDNSFLWVTFLCGVWG